METDFNFRLTSPENVILQELQNGEIIILNTDNENYYGLDHVSSEFYKIVINSNSLNSAMKEISNMYDVEIACLKHDLADFITELLDNNLLEIA